MGALYFLNLLFQLGQVVYSEPSKKILEAWKVFECHCNMCFSYMHLCGKRDFGQPFAFIQGQEIIKTKSFFTTSEAMFSEFLKFFPSPCSSCKYRVLDYCLHQCNCLWKCECFTGCLIVPAGQLHNPSKLVTSVALCCELHILGWHFIVGSLRHTCVIIRLSNKYLD